MADYVLTNVTFTQNIQGSVSITPASYQFELNVGKIGNTFTISPNGGYEIKNYSLNNVLYTESQIKELILTSGNSTEYNPQTAEYKHNILIIAENVDPNKVRFLGKNGLKRFYDNMMLKINSQKKVITILVSEWVTVNGGWTYLLFDSRITDTSNQTINMLPYGAYTEEQRQTISAMGLYSNGQGNGSLALIAVLNVPTIDIQLEVIFRGEK